MKTKIPLLVTAALSGLLSGCTGESGAEESGAEKPPAVAVESKSAKALKGKIEVLKDGKIEEASIGAEAEAFIIYHSAAF